MNSIEKKIRTIIADDEPAARESIAILISKHHNFEVIAQCKDGIETTEAIIALKPDLIFLDVQMPELNGFEVLDAIKDKFIPVIVFVTAFDQYALKAFEKSAIDYLLKPYNDERFYQSLEKAKQIIDAKNMQHQMLRIETLLANLQHSNVYLKKLTIKHNGQISFVPAETILFFESEGNFVKVHTQGGIKLANYTFKQLEEILDPKTFLRIHKSFMVNVNWIEMIESHFHGDYIVNLKNGSQVKLSRNYKEAFDRIVNQL